MTNAQADEVPFLRGMQREEIMTTTVDAAKEAWTLDAIRHNLAESVKKFMAEMSAQVREFMEARQHPDRGPDPGVNEDDDDLRTLMRAFIDMSKHVQRPSYSNGGDESNWKTIALWALGALQAGTLFVMSLAYSSMDKVKEAQTSMHDDIVQIKCKLDPQCRLVVNPSDRH